MRTIPACAARPLAHPGIGRAAVRQAERGAEGAIRIRVGCNVPPLVSLEANGNADVILIYPVHRQARQIAQHAQVQRHTCKAKRFAERALIGEHAAHADVVVVRAQRQRDAAANGEMVELRGHGRGERARDIVADKGDRPAVGIERAAAARQIAVEGEGADRGGERAAELAHAGESDVARARDRHVLIERHILRIVAGRDHDRAAGQRAADGRLNASKTRRVTAARPGGVSVGCPRDAHQEDVGADSARHGTAARASIDRHRLGASSRVNGSRRVRRAVNRGHVGIAIISDIDFVRDGLTATAQGHVPTTMVCASVSKVESWPLHAPIQVLGILLMVKPLPASLFVASQSSKSD